MMLRYMKGVVRKTRCSIRFAIILPHSALGSLVPLDRNGQDWTENKMAILLIANAHPGSHHHCKEIGTLSDQATLNDFLHLNHQQSVVFAF